MSHLWFQKNKQCTASICFSLERKNKINAVGAAHSSLLRMWELQFFQPNTTDLELIRQDRQHKIERPVGQPRIPACVQLWKAQGDKNSDFPVFSCRCAVIFGLILDGKWGGAACAVLTAGTTAGGFAGKPQFRPPELKTWGSSEQRPRFRPGCDVFLLTWHSQGLFIQKLPLCQPMALPVH